MLSSTMDDVVPIVSRTLNLLDNEEGVSNAISLLDQGFTMPFIARYRREETNGMASEEIVKAEEMVSKLRCLEKKRLDVTSDLRKWNVEERVVLETSRSHSISMVSCEMSSNSGSSSRSSGGRLDDVRSYAMDVIDRFLTSLNDIYQKFKPPPPKSLCEVGNGVRE